MKWETDKGKEEKKERNQGGHPLTPNWPFKHTVPAICCLIVDLLFNCLTVLLSGRCDRTEGTRWLQKSIVKRL